MINWGKMTMLKCKYLMFHRSITCIYPVHPVQLCSLVHYGNVIMGTMWSQITSLTIVYSTDYSDADQRKHQSSVSLAFVRGIHRRPGNSPHKWPVTRKMFPFHDVIMISSMLFNWLVPCHTLTKENITAITCMGRSVMRDNISPPWRQGQDTEDWCAWCSPVGL